MAAGATRRLRVIITGGAADVIERVIVELNRHGDDAVTVAEPANPGNLLRSVSGVEPPDALLCIGEPAAANLERLTGAAKAAGISRVIAVCRGSQRRPVPARRVRQRGQLRIRTGYVLGQASTGDTQRLFGAPVIFGVRGRQHPVQLIHHDDLARFVSTALRQPDWDGEVTLSAPVPVTAAEVAAALGKPYAELDARLWSALPDRLGLGPITGSAAPPGAVPAADLGFVVAYDSLDCLRDFHRANHQQVRLGRLRFDMPWRFRWLPAAPPRTAPAGEPQRHPAGRTGYTGEFDTTINPRYPAFTCANVAEAFPGPMTPLSLELAMAAMRATGRLAADIVQLTGELRRAVTEEQVGCFAHTIYVNLTVSDVASALLPGAGASAWRDLLFGAESGVDEALSDRLSLWSMVFRLPKIAVLLGGAVGESHRIAREARSCQRDPGFYSGCSDDALRSRLRWAHDDVVNAWAVAALASAGVVPIIGFIERVGGERLVSGLRGGTRNLASAGLMLGTYQLARQARENPAITATLRAADPGPALTALRSTHPRFAAQIDRVIAEYGHRGPAETELANPMFADTPRRFVAAIAKLVELPAQPPVPTPQLPTSPPLRVLAALGAQFQQARERVRDAAVRHTHTYRLIAREIGARLVERGVLDAPDDVFYLVRADLDGPPDRLRQLVSRRRAERQRLEHCRPPVHFVSYWQPQTPAAGTQLPPGGSLAGVAASAGSAKGRVRVLGADTLDELLAGEVLVAEHTDTGWTPFFCHAAAIVVDTGAQMSHAAVLAREFGIPCVVGAVHASRRLQTGQVVEVDGSAGRVIRLE